MKLCHVCLRMDSLYGKMIDFLCDLYVLGIQTVVMMMVAQSVSVSLSVQFLMHHFIHVIQVILFGNIFIKTNTAF